MKIYIAGKITGDPKYREKFKEAAADIARGVWMAADKCKPYVQPWAGTTVDNFPSIDAVPVVRCKDCRYLGRELDKGLFSCDDYNLPYCELDSYCSHGRRKEETKHAAD